MDKCPFQAPATLMKASEEKNIAKNRFLLKIHAKYLQSASYLLYLHSEFCSYFRLMRQEETFQTYSPKMEGKDSNMQIVLSGPVEPKLKKNQ